MFIEEYGLLKIHSALTKSVFLAEQWTRNNDSRVDMPSCQLAELGSMPGSVVDEINGCILLEGAQDETGMRVGTGVHDDIASATCIRSVSLRCFGVDAYKGAGKTSYNLIMKVMDRKYWTSHSKAGLTPIPVPSIPQSLIHDQSNESRPVFPKHQCICFFNVI